MARIWPSMLAVAMAAAGTAAFGGQMTEHVAKGNFDVQLTPTSAADAAVGAMAIAKTFHGDLDGTSAGQMLAVRTRSMDQPAMLRWSG